MYYNKLWQNVHFYMWVNPSIVNAWFYIFTECLETSNNESIIVGQQLQYQWWRYVQQNLTIIQPRGQRSREGWRGGRGSSPPLPIQAKNKKWNNEISICTLQDLKIFLGRIPPDPPTGWCSLINPPPAQLKILSAVPGRDWCKAIWIEGVHWRFTIKSVYVIL